MSFRILLAKGGQGGSVLSYIYMYSPSHRILALLSLATLLSVTVPVAPATAAVQDTLVKSPSNAAVY